MEIKDLGKSYGHAEILKGINLTIEQGSVLALIGPTGSGKTTLLRLVNLLERPSSGQIIFKGLKVSDRPEKDLTALRRSMAMVFQKPVMFRARVQENVSFGLKMRGMDGREKVREALSAVGLAGYESRDAGTLSGGEMQRIALARALVLEPELLLLDEPTANLDLGWRERMVEAIGELHRSTQLTVVLVCHELEVLPSCCGRVVVLDAGRIVADGHPNEVLSTEAIASLYGPGLRVIRSAGRWAVVPGEAGHA